MDFKPIKNIDSLLKQLANAKKDFTQNEIKRYKIDTQNCSIDCHCQKYKAYAK